MGRKEKGMTTKELKERIEKCLKKIESKKNTIAKKEALISKKRNQMAKVSEDEARWIGFDIEMLEEDLERLPSEIAEIEKTIAKYENLLIKAEATESNEKEMPEIFKELEKTLADKMIKQDLEIKKALRDEYDALGHQGFNEKHYDLLASIRMMIWWRDEEIIKRDQKDAHIIVLNLYTRVKEITGEITDVKNLHLACANQGICLNGIVIGKEGKAKVESVDCGGYNIQREHIRVLVHSI